MLNLFLLYSNATVGVVIPGLTGNLLLFRFLHCHSPLDGECPSCNIYLSKNLNQFL